MLQSAIRQSAIRDPCNPLLLERERPVHASKHEARPAGASRSGGCRSPCRRPGGPTPRKGAKGIDR
eukprot:9758421-Alexandrium_andersonii.AAC.1